MSENPKVSSKGDVPFSWEQKPGVSKVKTPQFHFHHHPKLPPPPCTFPAAALRNPSQKDPFLIAYKECTKSVRSKGNRFAWGGKDDAAAAAAACGGAGYGGKKKKKKKKKNSGKSLLFSCKNSCSVMEDKIVRVSQLPLSRSHREEDDVCMKWTP